MKGVLGTIKEATQFGKQEAYWFMPDPKPDIIADLDDLLPAIKCRHCNDELSVNEFDKKNELCDWCERELREEQEARNEI